MDGFAEVFDLFDPIQGHLIDFEVFKWKTHD